LCSALEDLGKNFGGHKDYAFNQREGGREDETHAKTTYPLWGKTKKSIDKRVGVKSTKGPSEQGRKNESKPEEKR